MFPNQWTPIKLYELAEWINGKAFKKDDYNITGLPVIKIAELNTGLSSNTKYSINNDEKFYIKKGDILFAWSGNPDTSIDTHKFKEKEGYLNQHIFKVLPNDNKIESDFLYYILKYLKPFFKEIARNKQTTGLGHVTISDLKKIQVRIPSENIQKEIADIFIILDSKIEINNKIISNLESQAQAIFKSWFVDFEPFQDGNFVESELGMIPEGWEVKELGELFKFVKGKKPKDLHEKYEDNFIPYIVKGVMDGSETPKFTNEINIVKIKKLDCFMLMDGANSGNIYYGYDGALGSTFGLIEAKNQIYRELIYWKLKTNESIIKNQNTGSAIPHANKDFISKMNVAIPINIEENVIVKTLENFRIKINSLNNQNTKLAELRDALLPKLMAGEIDVSNIKIEGEEVKNE